MPLAHVQRLSRTARVDRVALCGMGLAEVIVVLCSDRTPELAPASIRPAPPSLGGPLGGLGPDIHLTGSIVALTAMFLGYVVVTRRRARLSRRTVFGAVAILHVLVILGAPLMSTDVFSYGIYGRIGATYHFNPYLLGPAAVPYDRWYPLVDARWIATPTVYGPLFTMISYLLAPLSVRAGVDAYQLIALAASLTSVIAVAHVAGKLGRDPLKAVVLIGLNPVLLIYAVGGAHNDLLMLALLCASILLLIDDRPFTAGTSAVAAIAIKLTAAIVLPFALAGRAAGTSRRPGRFLIAATVAAVATGVASVCVFGTAPLHLLVTLQQVQGDGGHQSIPGAIAYALGLGGLGSVFRELMSIGLIVTFAVLLCAVLMRRVDWLTATGWAVVAVLVSCTFLVPWYVIWLLPFAALSTSRSLKASCLVLTAIGLSSL